MPIDPKKPAVGVPPLTRQGLHDNFKEALERINEFRDRIDALELTAFPAGGGAGIVARIQSLEEKVAAMREQMDMHDQQINALEPRVDKNELLSIENRQRIRELEQGANP